MVAGRSRAPASLATIATATAALLAAAACSTGAGLGERCGEWGHGTIACADGLYCSLPPGQGTGTCRQAGRQNEPCPAEGGMCGEPVAAGNVCDDVGDCQAGLMCNAGFVPARCEPLSEIGQPCASLQDCTSLNCDLVARTCQPVAAAPAW